MELGLTLTPHSRVVLKVWLKTSSIAPKKIFCSKPGIFQDSIYCYLFGQVLHWLIGFEIVVISILSTSLENPSPFNPLVVVV
ncbi:hypothetical protein M1N18_01235 [Dehalococcoidales bacterium]|nr:hypothetical protein [Dehalococcoidales bacterium]